MCILGNVNLTYVILRKQPFETKADHNAASNPQWCCVKSTLRQLDKQHGLQSKDRTAAVYDQEAVNSRQR